MNGTGDNVTMNGNLSLNNRNYSMIAYIKGDTKIEGIQIIPYLVLTSPTKKMIYRGKFEYVHRKKFAAEMSTTGFGPEDMTLKGRNYNSLFIFCLY